MTRKRIYLKDTDKHFVLWKAMKNYLYSSNARDNLYEQMHASLMENDEFPNDFFQLSNIHFVRMEDLEKFKNMVKKMLHNCFHKLPLIAHDEFNDYLLSFMNLEKLWAVMNVFSYQIQENLYRVFEMCKDKKDPWKNLGMFCLYICCESSDV